MLGSRPKSEQGIDEWPKTSSTAENDRDAKEEYENEGWNEPPADIGLFPSISNKAQAAFPCYYAFLGADIDRHGLHVALSVALKACGVMQLAMHYATSNVLCNGATYDYYEARLSAVCQFTRW
jgi:hypothetical protein